MPYSQLYRHFNKSESISVTSLNKNYLTNIIYAYTNYLIFILPFFLVSMILMIIFIIKSESTLSKVDYLKDYHLRVFKFQKFFKNFAKWLARNLLK